MPPSKGHGTLWTKEQDQFIRDNRKDMTCREMAERLDKTRNAVIGRSSRLDLGLKPRGPRSPEQTANTKSQVMKIKRKYDRNRVLAASATGNMLARTSQDERQGGMGDYKLAPLQEILIDLPFMQCEPVTLLDRRRDQCCWPLDGGLFCGLPKCIPEYGQTQYCQRHYEGSVRPHSEYRRPLRRRK